MRKNWAMAGQIAILVRHVRDHGTAVPGGRKRCEVSFGYSVALSCDEVALQRRICEWIHVVDTTHTR